MRNFWIKLPRPFTAMAPMDDVTDNVFRQVIMKAGRPDVFFTEFTNIDGLVHGGNGIPLRKLNFTSVQHPIVAQLWGTDPSHMEESAKLVKDLGFDGLDINMGCPVKDVVKKGAGSGLIGNYKTAEELIDAAKKGAKGIPISVKTRLGQKENIAKEWVSFLLSKDIAALTIHGRLAKDMSAGFAKWDEIAKVVELKNKISPETLIIGNGDVKSYKEVLEKRKLFGVDGVMIGRGVFGNPWVFVKEEKSKTKKDLLELALFHVELYEKTWGERKNFSILKKFFKMYVKGYRGASDLRIKLMLTKSIDEIKKILKSELN